MKPREKAWTLLSQVVREGAFPDHLLEMHGWDAFAAEILYGSIRRTPTLDWIINRLCKKRPPPEHRCLLMTGLYQIFFMDGVTDYAAANETVELSRKKGPKGRSGFINAVLRSAIRDREKILEELKHANPEIRFDMPKKLFKRWSDTYGRETTEMICQWCQERPETMIRIAGDVDSYVEELKLKGIDSRPHPLDAKIRVLETGCRVEKLPKFVKGAFYIQDASTSAAALMLNVQADEDVLDPCAAPGGKAIILGQEMRNRASEAGTRQLEIDEKPSGNLLAGDVQKARLDRLKQNLHRMNLTWVEVRKMDACDLLEACKDQQFDAILLDVPCSNTGVIRRRPDVRLRFSPKDLVALGEQQASILDEAVKVLRPGGRIVYSTCSIEPEENRQQVDAFLERHPSFRLEKDHQLIPGKDASDGAYAALLVQS